MRICEVVDAAKAPVPTHNKPHKDYKNFIYDGNSKRWVDKNTQRPAQGLMHDNLMKAYKPASTSRLGKAKNWLSGETPGAAQATD